MSDLIGRQAALDALIALTVYSNKRDLVKEADNHPNTWIEGVAECIDEIEDMPSAHPEIEERKEESAQNVPKEDLISRKAAISLANSLKDDLPNDERMADAVMAHNEGILEYQTKLSLLPSAQPELSDAVYQLWKRAYEAGEQSVQSEVIKCENCKHRGEKPISDGRYWCDIHDAYMYYCSDAERRTE